MEIVHAAAGRQESTSRDASGTRLDSSSGAARRSTISEAASANDPGKCAGFFLDLGRLAWFIMWLSGTDFTREGTLSPRPA